MDILLERIVECIGTKHGAKKELADHLGIHPNVITNWLNGRNKSYKRYVNEISSFYGVSADYLLGKTDQKEEPEQSRRDELASSVSLAMYDGAEDEELPDDIKNMAAAFALAMRQQKKPEQPMPPELKEAREILDKLDNDKLNAALLMLRGLLNK